MKQHYSPRSFCAKSHTQLITIVHLFNDIAGLAEPHHFQNMAVDARSGSLARCHKAWGGGGYAGLEHVTHYTLNIGVTYFKR